MIHPPEEDGRCTRGESLDNASCALVEPSNDIFVQEGDMYLPVDGESMSEGLVQLCPPEVFEYDMVNPLSIRPRWDLPATLRACWTA